MVFLWNFNPRKQREQSNNLNLQHLIGLPIFFSNLSFFNSRHLEKRFEGLLKLHVFSSLFFFSVPSRNATIPANAAIKPTLPRSRSA